MLVSFLFKWGFVMVVASKLVLIQPLGVSKWFGGQTRAIQWHVKSAQPVSTVSIFITEAKGCVGKPYPYEIVSTMAAPTNKVVSYKWQVPFAFRTSSQYQVRVVVEVDGEEPVTVVSKDFTIVQVGDAGNGKPPVIVDPIPSGEN